MTDITKNELSKLVWEKPLSWIAAEVGVSDARLHQLCDQWGIEKPPRGYWTKERKHGVKFDKKAYNRQRRAEEYADFQTRRREFVSQKGGDCYLCGITNVHFHFHHLEYSEESNYPRNSKSMSTRWKRLLEAEAFPDRFAILCPRCHGLVHSIERVDLDKLLGLLP